jgi:hypothetical protein
MMYVRCTIPNRTEHTHTHISTFITVVVVFVSILCKSFANNTSYVPPSLTSHTPHSPPTTLITGWNGIRFACLTYLPLFYFSSAAASRLSANTNSLYLSLSPCLPLLIVSITSLLAVRPLGVFI